MNAKAVMLVAMVSFSTPAAGDDINITMAGATYQPARVTAAVGDTLRFVNDDALDHNVFVPTAAFAVDLGKQEPGAEALLVLRTAGIFEVECVFHPDMVTVVEVR